MATTTSPAQWRRGPYRRPVEELPTIDDNALRGVRVLVVDDDMMVRGGTAALLVSGDTGAAELARVRSSGIPLLTKPVAPARLRAILRAVLASARHAP